jgi:tetratricopeptide (TPR) repeat protein
MTTAKKISRKQLLKEPDEFITSTGRLIRFFREHRKPILFGAGALAVVLVGVVAFRLVSERLEQTARSRFAALMDRHAALTAAPSPSEAETRALLEDFEAALQRYGSRDAARPARFDLANICFEAGETDRALELYARAMEDFEGDDFYRSLIRYRMGVVRQAQGDRDGAIADFQKVADLPGFFLRDEALFFLGRLYGEAGETEKSRAVFETLQTDYADSIYARLAREKTTG